MLLRIAREPGIRLRVIAADLHITESTACSIVTDLTAAGYLVKQKGGPLRHQPAESAADQGTT